MTLRTTLALGLLLAACKDTPPPAQCGNLAAPACPEDNGADVCSDPTCASVYACQSGTWSFLKDCPAYDPEAGAHPIEAGDDASSAPDVSIDAPPGAYGGPGCIDLQNPDCALGTAISCGGSAGCCDCQDLYVCQNGSWVTWGACTDAGIVPTMH
jgi:hypothetical protein